MSAARAGGDTPRGGDKVSWWPKPVPALDVAAVLGFLAVALGIYGRYAAKGGWFYDDWRMYVLLREQHGGFFAELHACARTIPGGRSLACVYHAGEYSVFGSHRTDYLYAAIAFLVLDATLLYAIGRRCHLSRSWAFLLGAGLVLFPASDSTRLWAVATIGQYVMAFVLGAILVTLSALGRRGRSAFALHLLGAALAIFAMVTYEVAVPLVAAGGATYYLAYRDRRALKRWMVDIGLVLLFLIYRLVLDPVSSETGFVVHRNASQTVHRALTLLNGAWTTWKFVYLPGALGTILLTALVVAIGAVLVATKGRFRAQTMHWFALFAFGLLVSAISALAYLTANDLYVPVTYSTFNRLNLPGSVGYVAMAVAVLGMVYEVARAIKLPGPVAAGLVAVIVAGSALHQLDTSASHIRSWEASWNDQRQALAGYRVALRGAPRTADIIGFDTPIWESGFVPVFSASWDLRGAIEYETPLHPLVAYPLVPTLTCGATGMVEGAMLIAAYDQRGAPLYFASPKRRTIVRVATKGACEQMIQKWGRPPFWGSTVTGVKFTT